MTGRKDQLAKEEIVEIGIHGCCKLRDSSSTDACAAGPINEVAYSITLP